MYLCYFVIISLRKGRVPSFEQTWIPFTQECFEPRLIEISSVVLEKNLWKFCQCIFTISLLSPLGKGWGPSFEQTWIPFTHGCFVPSFVEIGPAILEKKMKMRKVYDNANNDDDKDWQRTNFDQKSSLAQVSLKGFKNTPKIRAVIITILRCYHTLNYKSKISDISLAHFHFFFTVLIWQVLGFCRLLSEAGSILWSIYLLKFVSQIIHKTTINEQSTVPCTYSYHSKEITNVYCAHAGGPVHNMHFSQSPFNC